MTDEEAGLNPHLREQVGAHVRGNFVMILDCLHLSTCTNEPSGEDLCAR